MEAKKRMMLVTVLVFVAGTAGAQTRTLPGPNEGTDYGDAPAPYPTAEHELQYWEWLGAQVTDNDPSNPMTPAWMGDQYDDGVTWGTIIPGNPWWIRFSASSDEGWYNPVYDNYGWHENVEIWVDWNADGDWDDPGEKVVDWYGWVPNGINTVTVTTTLTVPSHTQVSTWPGIRARIAYDVDPITGDDMEFDLSPGGYEAFGEVEDYHDHVVPVELSSFTADADGDAILLRWITHTETENLGFHVYRSVAENGDYKKITPALIEGAGSSRTRRDYRFVDQDVVAGTTYFYKLAELDFEGKTELHGPIAATVEKTIAATSSTWGAVKAQLK